MKLYINEDINPTIRVDVFYYSDVDDCYYVSNDDLESFPDKDSIIASRYYDISEIMDIMDRCVNAKDVDLVDVEEIVIVGYKDKYYISTCNGFSDDGGRFTDTYDIEKIFLI